jgi:hypothetical protein
MIFKTFQVRASLDEANFFGFMPWIVVQRVTLPLAVFFHFHSAVICSQLFKEIYAGKNIVERNNNHKNSTGRRLTLYLLRTLSIDLNQPKQRDSANEMMNEHIERIEKNDPNDQNNHKDQNNPNDQTRNKNVSSIRFRRHTLAHTSTEMELLEFRKKFETKIRKS